MVSVRLFAGLRERAGAAHVDVELPDDATVADLLAALELAPRSCVAAINREYADADDADRAGRRGRARPAGERRRRHGAARARDRRAARRRRARPPPCATRAPAPSSLFEGVTRDVPAARLRGLRRDGGAAVARIAAEEAERHGLCAVAVEHRTGTVPLGEPSVIVAASAPHRGEAFAGARAVIDRVKAEAPIWKVEVDGADRRRVEGTLPPVLS